MSLVLVFDDVLEAEKVIVEGLRKECGDEATIATFDREIQIKGEESYERLISSWIDERFSGEQVALIACDKELGRYLNLPGLSASPVSTVARQKGIPFCHYSRQASENERDFARYKGLRQWDSQEITLEEPDFSSWIEQIASLFRGFEYLRGKYPDVVDLGTPASALAAILDHPQNESRFALYSSGEQGFLKETLAFYDPEKPNLEELHLRMPRILGNWLYLSLLRFPGVFVGKTAAASYLNIEINQFEETNVQTLFEAARYTGPFSDLGPWWWRHELDAILDESECEDGRDFAGHHNNPVEPCLDPQSDEPAGYYCMLTQKPVSGANSRGGISWFPSGADLARIRKDKFNEVTALLGMY